MGGELSVLGYAPLAEITGRSPSIAPEAINCSAPDTGNMEILAQFGTPEQQDRWLVPLLEGEIRSCFSMTEPDVASSDATNIRCRIETDGDEYVIIGRKWWSTGGARPRAAASPCVMGVTNPDAEAYHRQSMVLVPLDTPPGCRWCGTSTCSASTNGADTPMIVCESVRVPKLEPAR